MNASAPCETAAVITGSCSSAGLGLRRPCAARGRGAQAHARALRGGAIDQQRREQQAREEGEYQPIAEGRAERRTVAGQPDQEAAEPLRDEGERERREVDRGDQPPGALDQQKLRPWAVSVT
jgi:hypothetical protein